MKNPNQKRYLKENLVVFSKLDKIIENAKEISFSELDNKDRSEYSNYKYYVTNLIIDNKKYVIEFDTRVEIKNGIKERHFRLERFFQYKRDFSDWREFKTP